MEKIQISGQKKLEGKIKISGSKNSSLPILAASLLSDREKKLKNIPRLSDVFLMIRILESLNSKVSLNKDFCKIKNSKPKNFNVSYDLVRKMRASFLILGPLLTRYGNAEVSLPGGCAIGTRPVDLHIEGLKKMGANITIQDGYVKAKVVGKLKGSEINLKKISVGATENIMMAATLAEGTTLIKNAAREPEIVDLANFLIKMGAKISGQGTSKIKIIGITKLLGCEYKIMPDRIEAGTYALCVMGCSGKIILENMNNDVSDHLIKIFLPLKSLDLKKKIIKKLDSNKALDIVSIDLEGKSSIADYMIIASGTSSRHIQALSEQVYEELKSNGIINCKIEGKDSTDWKLVDGIDLVVHIFNPEKRKFYCLLYTSPSPRDKRQSRMPSSA